MPDTGAGELVGAPLQSDCTPFRTGAEITLTGCPESPGQLRAIIVNKGHSNAVRWRIMMVGFLNTLNPDRRASFLLRVQTLGTKQLALTTQTIPFEKIVRG